MILYFLFTLMLIPIVDKNDEIITYKERNEILHEDIYRIASLWVENEEGEVLLTQRASSKTHNPDKRTIAVNGTVEGKETYEENIIHETQEEIGIKISNPLLLNKELASSGGWTHFIALFFVRIPKESPFVFDPQEVQAVKWAKKAEVEQWLAEAPDDFV
jgi:isopentenyl-diphosphate delta-isomerase